MNQHTPVCDLHCFCYAVCLAVKSCWAGSSEHWDFPQLCPAEHVDLDFAVILVKTVAKLSNPNNRTKQIFVYSY